jgi:cytochrome c peroxidase
VFVDSPFDRYLAGDERAISESAKRGWALFNGKARCPTCHMLNPSIPLGTDNRFHNIGVAARKQNFEELTREALKALASDDSARQVDEMALQTKASELGRFLVTRNQADIGAFKTLQILNVGVTPPYMHDGSMRTLWDVMDHYNKGGEANPFLDGGIEPLALSEAEIDDMVEWMFTLTDVRLADQNQAEKQKQRQISRQRRPFRDDAMASRELLPFESVVQRRGAGGSPASRAQDTEAGKPGAASGSGPTGKASAGEVESSGGDEEE